MKNKNTTASQIISFSYYVDYASPTVPPYHPVVLGDKREDSRWIVSHRRPITDNNNIPIGDATYLVHVYRVDLESNKKSGLMYANFKAHHELKKDGKNYDILFSGIVKFQLGLRKDQTEVDPLIPINHIVKTNVECISAREIFEEKVKINSGKNKVLLKNVVNNNKNITNYRVAGYKEKY